jgi:TPR repeat protein
MEIATFAKALSEMISLDGTQKAEADARKKADADALALETERKRAEAARKAAEETRRLGLMYAYGQSGVPQDVVRARGLLEQAAAQGDAYAMFQLGILNEEGRGGPKDVGKAQEWFQKALDAGYGPARNALKNPR